MVIFACFVPCFERQSFDFCFVSTVIGLQARFRSDQKPPLLDIATQVRDTVAGTTQDIRCLSSPLVWPHRQAFDKTSLLICRCNCEKSQTIAVGKVTSDCDAPCAEHVSATQIGETFGVFASRVASKCSLCSLGLFKVLTDGYPLLCSGFLAHMSRAGSGDVTDSFADKQHVSL